MDLNSFLKGLALGLAGKPLEFAPGKEPDVPEKEPVAYLYNGVRLPKLPDSDKLHAIIMGDADLRNTYVYFSDSPVAYGAKNVINSSANSPYYTQAGEVVMYLYDSGKWTGLFGSTEPTVMQYEAGDSPPNGNGLLWTKKKICWDTDGSLYMEASDPIPVYE